MNRDIWSIYEEVRVPFTSPTWNFWGFYSFEVDFAEREEWYQPEHFCGAAFGSLPGSRRRIPVQRAEAEDIDPLAAA